jgi:hypothetical protein
MSYHFDCESFRLPLTIFISEAITKKPNNNQNDNSFCMQFFTLKALEIFKFEVFQQICCSFYCFRNMKRLKGNDAQICY